MVGYLFRPIGALLRVLFLVAAIGLLIPIVDHGAHVSLTWASNAIGLALGIALVARERRARSRAAPQPAMGAEGVKAPRIMKG